MVVKVISVPLNSYLMCRCGKVARHENVSLMCRKSIRHAKILCAFICTIAIYPLRMKVPRILDAKPPGSCSGRRQLAGGQIKQFAQPPKLPNGRASRKQAILHSNPETVSLFFKGKLCLDCR